MLSTLIDLVLIIGITAAIAATVIAVLPKFATTIVEFKQRWSEKTGKQRCSTIGGILAPIGIVLCLYAWHLDSHNARLVSDYRYAQHAHERNVERLEEVASVSRMQEVSNEGVRLANELADARLRLDTSSNSTTLIFLLWVLVGLSFITCFVLIIIGLALPEQNKPQQQG